MNGRQVRRLYALHKWTALITGLFVLVLSLTGAAAMFREDIDLFLTPTRMVPANDEALEGSLPLQESLSAVRTRYPDAALNTLEIPARNDVALTVVLRDDTTSREVFVDRFTATITGQRTGETVANVLRQTHVRFYFFSWQGRVAVGMFGIALLISSVTGLLLYGPFMKGLAFGTIRRKRLQLAVADWHKLLGIVTLVFNVVIAITGVVLGLENLQRFSPVVRDALHPGPPPALLEATRAAAISNISIDSAISSASAALPGVSFTRVALPSEARRYYRLRGSHDSRWTQQVSSDAVVHATSGDVLWSHDARTGRLITRAYNLNEPLHFGTFGGLTVRVLYAILGIASGGLSVLGFWLWILKRRRRRTARSTVWHTESAASVETAVDELSVR